LNLSRYGLFSWIYSFITAVSVILVNDATHQFNPAFTLLFAVLLSVLYFHIINWHHIPNIYYQLRKYWSFAITINSLVFIIWLSTFYSISLTNPFSFIMIYFAVPALISNIILLYRNQQIIQHGLAILLITATLISYIVLHALHVINRIQDIQGELLAGVGGLAAFAYRKTSFHFHQATQLSSTQILAIRSFGIIIVTPFLIPLHTYIQFWQASPHSWLLLIFLSFFTFIIPIYCNQQGIILSGVEKHSIIIASCPIFAYFLSLIFVKEQLLLSPKLLLVFAIAMSIGLILALTSSKKRLKLS
jgi:drug/metabolite transporter (DMT)-like permease